MTQKEREDRFIDRCRQEIGTLTYEAELLLRYGFSAGADELSTVAYTAGIDAQRETVLGALGAVARKETARP